MASLRKILSAVLLAVPILACSTSTQLTRTTPIAPSTASQAAKPAQIIDAPTAEGQEAGAGNPEDALIIFETVVYVDAAVVLVRQTHSENSIDVNSAPTWAMLAGLLGSKVDEAETNGVPVPLADAWASSLAAQSALMAVLEDLLQGTQRESLQEELDDASSQTSEAVNLAESVLIESYGLDAETISQSRQRARDDLASALSAMGGLTNDNARPPSAQATGASVRLGATKLTDNGGEVFGYVWGEVVNDSDEWLGEVLLSVFFYDADGHRIGALESTRAGGATIAVPQIPPHDVGVFVIPKLLTDISGNLDHAEVGLFNIESIPVANHQYTDISFAVDDLSFDLPYVDLIGSFTNTGASVCYNPIVAVGFYDSEGRVVGVVDTSGTGPIEPGDSEAINAGDLVWLNEPFASQRIWAQCDSVQD